MPSQYPPNYRANRWFRTDEDLLRTSRDAVLLARGECNEKFAADTMKRVKAYGMQTFFSEKQVTYLCKLADRVVPLPRETVEES